MAGVWLRIAAAAAARIVSIRSVTPVALPYTGHQGDTIMQRSALAVLLALTTLAWPAHAQDSAGGHVLLDATVRVVPGENAGLCLLLDTGGTLELSLQRVDDRDDSLIGAPLFALGPYRTSPAGSGDPSEIQGQPVTTVRTALSLPVESRLYCYSLSLQSTPAIEALPARERVAHFRFVALKLTLTPTP